MSVVMEAALNGGQFVWGAPTFDQVRVAWDEVRAAAGGVAQFNQATMTCTLPRGKIIFRSLDNPDNARGHTANGVVIDEGGDVKELAWYEVLRPMLIDTGGWAWVIGTPKGRNWFWREFLAAKDREDSISWQIPTLGCRIDPSELIREPHPLENGNIPFSELVQIWQTTPEHIFRQEILAEFLEGEGLVFRNILANLTSDPTDAYTHQAHNKTVGVDWGKLNDYTAISVYCDTCKREVDKDRFNQIDYHIQRRRLKTMVERWKPRLVLAESNAMGEPIIDELKREGLPIVGFTTTASSKPPLIENLVLAFERSEAKWIYDPVWTGELEAYEMKSNANTGRPTYSAPSGLHDDTVIARALALEAANRRQAVVIDYLKTDPTRRR